MSLKAVSILPLLCSVLWACHGRPVRSSAEDSPIDTETLTPNEEAVLREYQLLVDSLESSEAQDDLDPELRALLISARSTAESLIESEITIKNSSSGVGLSEARELIAQALSSIRRPPQRKLVPTSFEPSGEPNAVLQFVRFTDRHLPRDEWQVYRRGMFLRIGKYWFAPALPSQPTLRFRPQLVHVLNDPSGQPIRLIAEPGEQAP